VANKRNRRKMGNNSPVSSNINDIDEIREDSFSDEDMERGFKNKKHDHCDCGPFTSITSVSKNNGSPLGPEPSVKAWKRIVSIQYILITSLPSSRWKIFTTKTRI